jgi:hypothetical protein
MLSYVSGHRTFRLRNLLLKLILDVAGRGGSSKLGKAMTGWKFWEVVWCIQRS